MNSVTAEVQRAASFFKAGEARRYPFLDKSRAKEFHEEFGDASGFFVLEPVGGPGKGEEFGAGTITQTFVSHFGQEERVSLAPENARGDVDGTIRKFHAMTKQGAVPVHHRGERSGLRPRFTVSREILGRERAGAAGAQERSGANPEMESREDGFRQPGELEEKHVPTAKDLPTARCQESAHHGRMRNIENHQFANALRMTQSRAPSDGGAPIVPGKEDSLLAKLIRDSDDVGNQFGKRVGSNAGRFTAEIVPALIRHDDTKAGVGQRFDLLAPAIPEFGEAVQKQDDRAVARAGSDGMQANRRILEIKGFHRITPAEQSTL